MNQLRIAFSFLTSNAEDEKNVSLKSVELTLPRILTRHFRKHIFQIIINFEWNNFKLALVTNFECYHGNLHGRGPWAHGGEFFFNLCLLFCEHALKICWTSILPLFFISM